MLIKHAACLCTDKHPLSTGEFSYYASQLVTYTHAVYLPQGYTSHDIAVYLFLRRGNTGDKYCGTDP